MLIFFACIHFLCDMLVQLSFVPWRCESRKYEKKVSTLQKMRLKRIEVKYFVSIKLFANYLNKREKNSLMRKSMECCEPSRSTNIRWCTYVTGSLFPTFDADTLCCCWHFFRHFPLKIRCSLEFGLHSGEYLVRPSQRLLHLL